MHLVPLMEHTRQEFEEAARLVYATGDENLIVLFLMTADEEIS